MVKNPNEIVNHILHSKSGMSNINLTHKQHEKMETKQQERLEHEFSKREKDEYRK